MQKVPQQLGTTLATMSSLAMKKKKKTKLGSKGDQKTTNRKEH
jgi:hypothetical protein